VLQCVAVCCSPRYTQYQYSVEMRRLWECVVVCCSVLQCDSVRNSHSSSTQLTREVYGSVLQCVAVCCSVLQCVAVQGTHSISTR